MIFGPWYHMRFSIGKIYNWYTKSCQRIHTLFVAAYKFCLKYSLENIHKLLQAEFWFHDFLWFVVIKNCCLVWQKKGTCKKNMYNISPEGFWSRSSNIVFLLSTNSSKESQILSYFSWIVSLTTHFIGIENSSLVLITGSGIQRKSVDAQFSKSSVQNIVNTRI